uniref:Glycoside hydrolase family 5 domain-containing protein n=1 Tax=Alexandrium monilatum TaxID=311494 RepID=A0A7S4QEF9_9DINO
MPRGPPPPRGRLAVRCGRLTGADGRPVSLAGVSLFWSQWMGHLYSAEVVAHLAKDFGATLVRAALGVHESSGYLHDPETESSKVFRVVDAAIQHGMYAIIDWHSHEAHTQLDEAAAFFSLAAKRYTGCANVIYELWNEPLEVPWGTVKDYAERIIGEIRAHDKDNLIVVGTPRWSQAVDLAASAPLSDPNVAYALHFYAGTHGAELRAAAERALAKGACLFVTEWGAVEASGDGAVAHESVGEWVDFLRRHGLSHAAWALSTKAEGASILQPHAGASPLAWTEESLTESGRTIRAILRGWSLDHRPGGTTDGAVEVWWPGEGVKVYGVQPFKLVLRRSDGAVADADGYEAWWSVDGGMRNAMGTASEPGSGCRHKEFMCNMDGWKWRGRPGHHGPFSIAFTCIDRGASTSVTATRTIYTVG